jgi:hypothetical protein
LLNPKRARKRGRKVRKKKWGVISSQKTNNKKCGRVKYGSKDKTKDRLLPNKMGLEKEREAEV